MNYVNIIDQFISDCPYVNLERVSLWDNIYQFLPDVYMFLMRLDTETLINAFLGEALVDLVEFIRRPCSGIFVYPLYMTCGRDITTLSCDLVSNVFESSFCLSQ